MLDEWLRGSKQQETEPGTSWWANRRLTKYIIVGAICLGLLALLWPAGRQGNSVTGRVAAPGKANENPVKTELVASLESILSQIQGAGQVDVSISLASDGLKSYASNSRDESREITEGDSNNGSKKTSEETTVRDLAVSGGNPLLVENKTPEVMGVLVVADGADSPEVCERLMEATATLLNISPHQVSVMPREK